MAEAAPSVLRSYLFTTVRKINDLSTAAVLATVVMAHETRLTVITIPPDQNKSRSLLAIHVSRDCLHCSSYIDYIIPKANQAVANAVLSICSGLVSTFVFLSSSKEHILTHVSGSPSPLTHPSPSNPKPPRTPPPPLPAYHTTRSPTAPPSPAPATALLSSSCPSPRTTFPRAPCTNDAVGGLRYRHVLVTGWSS